MDKMYKVVIEGYIIQKTEDDMEHPATWDWGMVSRMDLCADPPIKGHHKWMFPNITVIDLEESDTFETIQGPGRMNLPLHYKGWIPKYPKSKDAPTTYGGVF